MNALREPPPLVSSTLISLQQARCLLPFVRPGKRMHVSTLRGWIFAGKLPAIWLGGRWYVEPEDVKALLVPAQPTQITPAAKAPDQAIARAVKLGMMSVTPEERERLVKKGLLPKPTASPAGLNPRRRRSHAR